MPKKLYCLFFIIIFSFASLAADQDAKSAVKEAVGVSVVDDGFLADGVEGWAKKETSSGVWSFVPEKMIDAGGGKVIASGQPVQMLPCAVLEQIVKLAGQNKQLQIRLWAVFTKYKYANYLYSVYFLPIQDQSPKPPAESQTPAGTQHKAAQPEDSIIPE